MADVVALALPGGPGYVAAIRRVWDDGDAIAPLDPRLPAGEAARVLDALAPAAVIEADGSRRRLPDGRPVEDGDALVIATSGTTGTPKAVIHTHDGIRASAEATSRRLGVDPQRDRWLACLPLAHIGGLSVVLRSLVTGTPVEVHERFDPEATIEAARRGATLVSLVTRALNQVPATAFRTILLGGAAPPAERPANAVTTYGSTETGSGVLYDRVPLDGVDLDLAPDGEVLVRAPMLFRAYRHDPDPFRPGGWFPTGDIGRWGDDGLLLVDGRRGDVIVTGGEKVWPARIEAFLAERHDIAEVALIGRPDVDWGHRVVAVVVPAVAGRPPDLYELKQVVKDEFGPWAAPRELELRDSLPRTALGKVRRDALAAPATRPGSPAGREG